MVITIARTVMKARISMFRVERNLIELAYLNLLLSPSNISSNSGIGDAGRGKEESLDEDWILGRDWRRSLMNPSSSSSAICSSDGSVLARPPVIPSATSRGIPDCFLLWELMERSKSSPYSSSSTGILLVVLLVGEMILDDVRRMATPLLLLSILRFIWLLYSSKTLVYMVVVSCEKWLQLLVKRQSQVGDLKEVGLLQREQKVNKRWS
mmetsp:Transcript_4626/g.9621  ORF Transcript_4626/g.9621 Transcript_4626/m.9621 type:complete len:209 (+) Transcript_4626:1494-2120(+)